MTPKGLMYGLENRFKMQVLLGLKRAHCEMGIQQPRTTSVAGVSKQRKSKAKRKRASTSTSPSAPPKVAMASDPEAYVRAVFAEAGREISKAGKASDDNSGAEGKRKKLAVLMEHYHSAKEATHTHFRTSPSFSLMRTSLKRLTAKHPPGLTKTENMHF